MPTTGQVSARRDPAPLLWSLTAAGWVALLALEIVPGAHPAHPAEAVAGLAAGPLRPAALALFTGGWLVMVAAMMLPTTVPMARMFTVVSSRQDAAGPVRAAFFAAYLAVWLGFAVVALVLLVAIAPLLHQVPHGIGLAGALLLAGTFQFTPLKQRCLTLCRDPAAFLFTRYRRGVGGAWSVGTRHALSCLGCCWALMLIMFATGVADLVWMLGLTAVMVAEKTARWGRRLVRPVGVVLLLAGIAVALAGTGPPAHLH